MRQWYQISNKENTAEIMVYDVIGESWMGGVSAKQFVTDLKAIDAENINVRINSPGGDVFDGIAMYNALIAHPAMINTKIEGAALSMASVVAMAGDTIQMAENASLMVHNPWTFAMGDASEFRKVADVLEKSKLNLIAAYNKRSNLSDDEISALMDEETWLNGPEALEKGFVTEVLSPVKLAASFDKSALEGYKNVPERFMESELPEPTGRKVAALRRRMSLM